MASSQKNIKFSSKEDAHNYLAGLHKSGYAHVAGVDECGRGPYAGPVVAACVVLPENHGIEGISDSKKICPRRREELSGKIREVARYGIGVRDAMEIDSTNILISARKAATDAVMQCLFSGAEMDYVLCDGNLYLSELIKLPTSAVVKGDLWYECIGAASIIAKVYRDNLMLAYHDLWPEYGFDTNQGYGTAKHVEAIQTYGISPIHRRSFGICKGAPERKNGY